MGQRNANAIPASYTLMEEDPFHIEEQAFVPFHEDINTHPIVSVRGIEEVLKDGYHWLDIVSHHIETELTRDKCTSWAEYHAVSPDTPSFRTNSSMLLLLMELGNSPLTILHCMSTICRAQRRWYRQHQVTGLNAVGGPQQYEYWCGYDWNGTMLHWCSPYMSNLMGTGTRQGGELPRSSVHFTVNHL